MNTDRKASSSAYRTPNHSQPWSYVPCKLLEPV